jgi:hypothetical protein
MNSNETKLVAFTNREIEIMIDMMRKNVPSKDDENTVVIIVEKLRRAARS